MALTLIEELQAMTDQGVKEREAMVKKLSKEALNNAILDIKAAARNGHSCVTLQVRYKDDDGYCRQYMHEVSIRVDAMLVGKGIKRRGVSCVMQGKLGVSWGLTPWT